MNIDPNTPERDVLIAYLENSGVSQQRQAAAEMKKMQEDIDFLQSLIANWFNAHWLGRIVLWFKKGK